MKILSAVSCPGNEEGGGGEFLWQGGNRNLHLRGPAPGAMWDLHIRTGASFSGPLSHMSTPKCAAG